MHIINNKYYKFLEIAKILNEKYDVLPLLYGSLGLSLLLAEDFVPQDVDMLIPEKYINEEWNAFQKFLETNNYKMIDLHEHTFQKDGIDYNFASIEDLKPFANINLKNICEYNDKGIKYKQLSLDQYLKVYRKSSTDGYRMGKKNNADNYKIKRIKEKLDKIKEK